MDRSGNMRSEVVDAFRAIDIPLYRFPGGIHADYYDWRAGAEPRDRRRQITNIFTNRSEPQPLGSPEFVNLIKTTRAEMLITANYGTGSAEDAGAWARWFKDQGLTPQFWEVGNEIYLADPNKEQPNGKRIAKSGRQYASDFPRYRSAILAATPGVKVGLIGHVDDGAFPIAPAARKNWTEEMLDNFRGQADFIAVHNAYAPVVINDSIRFTDERTRLRVYRTMYAAPQQSARNFASMAALLDRHPATRGLPIAITEWGPLFGYSNKRDVTSEYADQSRRMAAAVYVAALIDWMLGEPRLLLATYTNPIHEFYGSLLTDTDRELVKTPSYHVFAMYRSRFESRLVPATVEAPQFSADTVGLINAQSGVPEVSARASISSNGRRLTAMLVNRSVDKPMQKRITIDGFAAGRVDCQVLAGSSPSAINGPPISKSTTSGRIAPAPINCSGDPLAVTIPPSAVVSLVADRK
jgi:alpha-N-arabinofuranosidase